MKRKTTVIISLLLMFFSSAPIFPQTGLRLGGNAIKNASLKIDSLAESRTDKDSPGFAVMVIYNGRKIFHKGFGSADLNKKIPINSHTDFYLASVSKEFTTMAVMILHDRGLLRFDDKVYKILPGFPSYGKDITIRSLMTHTSGLPDYYSLLGYSHDFKGITNGDVWNLLLKQDSLNFPPGSRYQYSNSGYVILSMIVSKISGMPFAEFLKKNIFDRLHMKNTLVVTPTVKSIPHRAAGYSKDSTGQYKADDYNQFTTGAGGIYSNTSDLYKWDQALYTGRLVRKSTLAEAFTRQKLNDGSTIDYGFGWMIGNFKEGRLKGIKYLYHTGALDGFRNLIFRIPALHFSYIVLSNTGEHLAAPDTIAKIFFEK